MIRAEIDGGSIEIAAAAEVRTFFSAALRRRP